jgi:hypothetical protein
MLTFIIGNNITVGTNYRWNTRKMGESERFTHMFDKHVIIAHICIDYYILQT